MGGVRRVREGEGVEGVEGVSKKTVLWYTVEDGVDVRAGRASMGPPSHTRVHSVCVCGWMGGWVTGKRRRFERPAPATRDSHRVPVLGGRWHGERGRRRTGEASGGERESG